MQTSSIAARALAALALGLLGAHFWRAGGWPLVAACAALMPVALLAQRRWLQRLVQAALVAGTLEWLWTAFRIAQQRDALGAPWGRMALILGAVALLTATAAWWLGRRR